MEGAKVLGFPLVMKVVGPVHKTDCGGVALNVPDIETLKAEFDRMMLIKDAKGVMIQPMINGIEMFIGSKQEGEFGNMIMCGLGGIFVEVLKDVQSSLTPVNSAQAMEMLSKLKGYKILKGARGKEGINIELFAQTIQKVAQLCDAAGCISEMDINPLICDKENSTVVDARIKIKK